MTNETISRMVGVFLGAALIVAGFAAFGSQTVVVQQHHEVRTSVAFRLAPQAGRHVAAHEFPDFPFHRRLHRILEIGGITRIEKGHV